MGMALVADSRGAGGHAHQSALETEIDDYAPDFPIGAAGADLLFVISGFVI
jgi:hypothetical protein